jgi:hypothetical protein
MSRRRALTTALTASLAALIGVAGAATATANGIGVPGGGRPDRQIGVSMDLTFPATPDPLGVCSFPVSVTDVEFDVIEKHYADGSTKGAGRHVVRITNLLSPENYAVRDISGPGRTYTDSAGVFHYVLTGASLTWVWPGKDTTGTVAVGLYVRHGNVEYDGDLNLLSYTGSAENLCQTLA